jgi:hypothetical protein
MKNKFSKICNKSHFHNFAWIIPTTNFEGLCKHVFTSFNNYPIVTQEIALNSSSIMILKMRMSSQTNSFKSPNDLHHFQNVTNNLLHFWSLEVTSLNFILLCNQSAFWKSTNHLLNPFSQSHIMFFQNLHNQSPTFHFLSTSRAKFDNK